MSFNNKKQLSSRPFIFDITTTSSDETFTLPFVNIGTVKCTIFWI